MTYLVRKLSKLLPTDKETSIKLVSVLGSTATVDYNGKQRKFSILPDGDILMIVSLVPKGKYRRAMGGYEPVKSKHGYTISGVFPIYRVNETGEWVWLDYDGSFKHWYVNLVERCDEYVRVLNDRKPQTGKILKRRNPDQPRVEVKKVPFGYQWSAWEKGEITHTGLILGDDPTEARQKAWQAIRKERRQAGAWTNVKISGKVRKERDGSDWIYYWQVSVNGEVKEWGWAYEKADAQALVAKNKARFKRLDAIPD